MADDEKNKVHSLPPPPTDEIDDEWGSSGKASAAPVDKAKATASKTSTTKSAAAKSTHADDDDEDDDYDDEDDDEDDDDEDERPARGRHGGPPPKSPAASQDWLPDWAPWAVLGALLFLGFLGGVGLLPINTNLKPSSAPAESATVAAAAASAAPAKTKPKSKLPGEPPSADGQERVAASHLLVSYKGSLRAQPSVTRTKEEALKRATAAMKRARKGDDFEKLVAEYSDEPGAAERGGKLGRFTRERMVKEFADAAFAMKVGEISDVVETKFGYHVIKRTE